MKKMLTVSAMALVSLLTLAAISIAADNPASTAEAPVLVKGESWTLNIGSTETFLRQEGDALVFYQEGKGARERYRTRDLNLMYDLKDGVPVNTRKPHFGLLAFPLYIGKAWGHSYQNRGTWRTNDYKVTAFEKVTVKAGTFDAFRIEGVDKRNDSLFGIRVIAWYAPVTKSVIKMTGENEYDHMGIEGWNWELSSFNILSQNSPLVQAK